MLFLRMYIIRYIIYHYYVTGLNEHVMGNELDYRNTHTQCDISISSSGLIYKTAKNIIRNLQPEIRGSGVRVI